MVKTKSFIIVFLILISSLFYLQIVISINRARNLSRDLKPRNEKEDTMFHSLTNEKKAIVKKLLPKMDYEDSIQDFKEAPKLIRPSRTNNASHVNIDGAILRNLTNKIKFLSKK